MASMTLTLSAADASPPPQPNLAETSGAAAILALDLGTTTGWAFRNLRGRILSGTADFKPHRFEGGGMRYLRFERWLDETLRLAGDVEAVYFEEVRRHAGVDAAHAYGGFLAGLTAWCEENAIAYQGVPVGTWKRHACGKGNADKAAVIAAVQDRGFAPVDDNEADAIAILLWAIETRGGTR
jgi:Holliday junction resolvasome RuvABC endonuclease subunit